jgi:hypothetical protein
MNAGGESPTQQEGPGPSPLKVFFKLGVTFGACMSVENKRRIIRVCETSGIEYNQALILRDKHEEDAHGERIGRVELPLPEHSSKLIDICPRRRRREAACSV